MNSSRRYGAVVVGGGRAGLSVSHFLAKAEIEHVVFEKKTAMHKWRDERWDAFCLVPPNRQCQLPGHAYDGADPRGRRGSLRHGEGRRLRDRRQRRRP